MQDDRSAVSTRPAVRRATFALSVAAVAVVGLTTLGTTANASAASAGAGAKARPAAPSALSTSSSASAPQAAAAAYWTTARLEGARSADLVTVTKAQAAAMAKEATPARGAAGGVAGSAPSSAAARVGSKAVRPMNISGAVNWGGSLSSAPATTTGRVFFSKYTAGGAFAGNFSCSGSLMNSEGKDMVWTAGHCVHGGAGYGYHRNWIFIPGYRNGSRPEGTWYAKRLQTLTGWSGSSDFRYDMGVGLVSPDGLGRQAIALYGGQGIMWNYSAGYFAYDFGYPADPPFNGTTLKVCTDDTFTDVYATANIGINCNMTGGSSGGPWLRNFTGTWGYVNGQNSYKYGSIPANIYSPYYGNGAMNLYNANRYL